MTETGQVILVDLNSGIVGIVIILTQYRDRLLVFKALFQMNRVFNIK